MRSLGDRLRDIASAIESIEETVRPAVDQLRQLRAEYPWARTVAVRNILATAASA